MRFGLCGTFIAADGQRDELVRVLLDAADALEADRDCVQYTVGVAGEDEVGVFELWESEEAHSASLQRPEIQAVIARGRPLIAGVGGQIRIVVEGGKRS